jgi:ParB family chromosome partitioning protein
MKDAVNAALVSVMFVLTSLIKPNPLNPRKRFDTSEMEQFGLDLQRNGIKTPLRVFTQGDGYMLISGERRLRGALAVGIEKVPVIVEPEPVDETAFLKDQLIDNEQRQSLGDEAITESLLKLKKKYNSNAKLAREVGLTESDVSRLFTIHANLAPEIRQHVSSGVIPVSVGYELAKVRPVQRQIELAHRVMSEGLSRAELIAIIRAERSVAKRSKSKPVRVIRTFAADAGFEPIKQQLEAMLSDVQRCIKNGIPVGYLNELWGSPASH